MKAALLRATHPKSVRLVQILFDGAPSGEEASLELARHDGDVPRCQRDLLRTGRCHPSLASVLRLQEIGTLERILLHEALE